MGPDHAVGTDVPNLVMRDPSLASLIARKCPWLIAPRVER